MVHIHTPAELTAFHEDRTLHRLSHDGSVPAAVARVSTAIFGVKESRFTSFINLKCYGYASQL